MISTENQSYHDKVIKQSIPHAKPLHDIYHGVAQAPHQKTSPQQKKGIGAPSTSELNHLTHLFNQGLLQESKNIALQFIQQFPKHGIAWKVLGVIYQQEGLLEEAGYALKKAAEIMPKDVEAQYNLANYFYDQKQLQVAKTYYLKAVKMAPNFASGHYNLGSVLKDLGQYAQAEASYRKALKLEPNHAQMLFNLGLILHEQKRYKEAVRQYEKALLIQSNNASVYLNMGASLRSLGEVTQAEQCYIKAIELDPKHAGAYNNLGIVLKELERLDEAEAAYLEALKINPEYTAAYKNLGFLYKDMGKVQESESCYIKALSIEPPTAETLNNMAALMISQGRYAEAEIQCRKALALAPAFGDAWNNLGLILQARMMSQEAEVAFESALKIQPEDVHTLTNYSITLKKLGKLRQAELCLKKAIVLKPNFADAYLNLGTTYVDQGLIDEGIAATARVLEIVPKHLSAHDNLLFAMNYSSKQNAEECLAIALKYGRITTDKVEVKFTTWLAEPDPKRLRVGVVSGDLRQHPVAYFLKNVIKQVDASKFEFIAYSTDGREDATTADLKPYFAEWRSLAGYHDQAAASIIHQDKIHVLLDLSGHTAGNKLPIFAWKPAPVQASWLGYWATTGIEAIDYLIADKTGVPECNHNQFTEKIKYLPDTRLCFSAPELSVDVAPLPALENGYITFGCFQNITKVSNEVLSLWAKVMQAIPEAKLRWQCASFADEAMVKLTNDRLLQCGINLGQVSLFGKVSREEYLAAHAGVDVILDTFPFTGGTTTCEALWMGVPTLSLAGNTLVARQGASLLTAAGLVDWVVNTNEEYIEQAQFLCSNLTKLATLRKGLRAKVMASPLFDSARFANNLEVLLWEMWEENKNIVAKENTALISDTSIDQENNDQKLLSDDQITVEIVSATRMSENDFWHKSALGISLKRHMKQDARLRANIAFKNTIGLSTIFNERIASASEDAILVFIHDDVWIDEVNFVETVIAGLAKFDVIGVAGNKRRVANQPAWTFIDAEFTWDNDENLSGRIAHGEHAHGEVSDYGAVPAPCELLDGVLLAVKREKLVASHVSFDTQFDFHFYDLDFCRAAREAGLTLGTWPVKLTHQSKGAYGNELWRHHYLGYLNKWEKDSSFLAESYVNADVKVFQLGSVEEVVKQFQAIELLSEVEYVIPEIPVFGSECPNPAVSQSYSIKHPAVCMASVDDFKIIGSAAFPIIQNKSIPHQYFSADIWETSEQGLGYCRIREDKNLIGFAELTGQAKHNCKVINLIGNGSSNYAHWLTEFLPQIILLKNANVDISQYQILMDANSYPSMLEALYLLGIKKEQLVFIKPLSLNEFPEALWVSPVANVVFQRPNALHGVGKDMLTEPQHAIFHPQALHVLRNEYLPRLESQTKTSQPEKIFIKRTPGRAANLRVMVNENEIEQMLVANGFVSIDPSRLTFEQQITLFSQAKYIVSASGAALVNMLWAPSGAHILVLMNDTRYANYWYFGNIAACVGHHLMYVLGNALPSKHCTDLHHADFEIDVNALEAALNFSGLDNLQNPKKSLDHALQEVMQLAIESQNADDPIAAEQLYQEVLKVEPQHADANHHLGVIEVHLYGPEKALPRLEIAVQAKPENEQYWVSYIDALMMAGGVEQAFSALDLGVQFGLKEETAEILRAEFKQTDASTKIVRNQKPIHQVQNSDQTGMICTLIPGYKPDYIQELLLSLATQTYQKFKVIISDDSPNDEVTEVVNQLKLKDQLKGLSVEVVCGPKKGGFANIFHLVRTYAKRAEFFHILMDDDLIYPTFYETHMREHARVKANFSISARWKANEAGQPCAMPMDEHTSSYFVHQFDAKAIARALIPTCNNKLGEWSHAVFRQKVTETILNPSINNIGYFGLDDIGSFINAAQDMPAIWIPTPLGIFRTNPHQNTGKLENATIKCAHYSWISFALIAVENQWISEAEAWSCISTIRETIRARYKDDTLGSAMLSVLNKYSQFDANLKPEFLSVWNQYLQHIQVAEILAGDLTIKLR